MTEQMKSSGIDWIGDIPESWSIKRIKYCTDIIMGQSPDSNLIKEDNGIYPFMQGNAEFTNLYPKPSLYCDFPNKVSRVGDILMSVRAPVGELNISDREYGIGRGLCSIRPAYFNTKYFWYFMLKSKGDFSVFSNGSTFEAITTENLLNFPCVVPGIQEQQAIADFLDKECAQIDSIAADLEKQIALLQQYKKSLITETVTKGLDKSVPMKDSGVEWFGEIPVGWELSRIKYLTDNHHPYPIGDGDHGMIKADDYLTEGIPYIRVLNLTWGSGLNLENLVFISKEMNTLIKNSELKPNDILIAKTGATIGKTAIVPDSLPVSNTTSHVGKITLANVHDAKYFYYVMTSSIVQKQIQDISAMQSTRPELGIEGLKNLILTVPPFDIQQYIARFLDDHCAKIDRVLHEKGKQLSVIKQHKKSLIYEYVTGKKRVKEVQ